MGWLDKLFKKGDAVVVQHDTEEPSITGYDNDVMDVTPANPDAKVVVVEEGKPKLEEAVPDVVEEEPEPEAAPVVPAIEPLDLMKVDFQDSPNKSSRQAGEEPLYIVLHHTGPGSFNGIVDWLCNKDAKASAHYVLGTNGQLKQLVNTKKQAWHAGRAKWGDELRNNSHSIGIEICNYGVLEKGDDGNFYYEVGRQPKKYTGKVEPVAAKITYPSGHTLSGYAVPYPEKQLNKLVALCKALVKKYPAITRDNIVTHLQIATPEGRKNDPFGLDVEKIKDMIFG